MRKGYMILLWCIPWIARSQQPESVMIQFSGIVQSSDSVGYAIPFASVYNLTLKKGTVASYEGFFSLVVSGGDTIEFSSIGYRKRIVVIPELVDQPSYVMAVFLKPEIASLPNTTIYPWFSKEQFRDAFIHLQIPDDDLARAKRNLNAEMLKALGENLDDPDLAAARTLQAYSYQYYSLGQVKPQPILSPSAWMQFFNALKNGDLKRD